MANIRTSCSSCGDLELPHTAYTVLTCVETDKSTYRFRCTRCNMFSVKSIEPRTAELLIASGVKQDMWHLPLELIEPRDGDPVDHDFVLDGYKLLVDDDAFTAELKRFALTG